MPAYNDVAAVIDGLVALIKEAVAKMEYFINGFKKVIVYKAQEGDVEEG